MATARGQAGQVLVAEDEAVMRAMLSDMLGGAGFSVIVAADGGEALEAARRQPLDLAILDVMMPVYDGFEVCHRLKESARAEGKMLPVLLLTALETREARLQGLAMGADDYVTKPFGLEELLLRAHGLVENKRFYDDLARRHREVSQQGEQQRKLAAFLVHDFKNPLGALDANLQLLHDSSADALAPRARACLEDARSCARRLGSMVNALLDVYKAEEQGIAIKARPVDLSETLRGCALEFEGLARLKGQHLDVSVVPGLTCEADQTLLLRVLGNLLTNAIRYTPKGKRIELSAKASEPDGVQLAVEDEAMRIAPEHRERIFEKFGRLQTSEELPGHGLGLTFCRLAVQAHGGTIWLEQGAAGNRFVLSLPKVALQANSQRPPGAS